MRNRRIHPNQSFANWVKPVLRIDFEGLQIASASCVCILPTSFRAKNNRLHSIRGKFFWKAFEYLPFSAVVEIIGENRRISVSRNAENSTVFPIPVRLWIFFSVLRRLGGLELELQAVSDQGDKFGVRRFPLGDAHGVAKEALRGVAGIAGEATAPCDYGVNHPGLPQRAAGPYERGVFANGGGVQSIGAVYDTNACAVWNDEC